MSMAIVSLVAAAACVLAMTFHKEYRILYALLLLTVLGLWLGPHIVIGEREPDCFANGVRIPDCP